MPVTIGKEQLDETNDCAEFEAALKRNSGKGVESKSEPLDERQLSKIPLIQQGAYLVNQKTAFTYNLHDCVFIAASNEKGEAFVAHLGYGNSLTVFEKFLQKNKKNKITLLAGAKGIAAKDPYDAQTGRNSFSNLTLVWDVIKHYDVVIERVSLHCSWNDLVNFSIDFDSGEITTYTSDTKQLSDITVQVELHDNDQSLWYRNMHPEEVVALAHEYDKLSLLDPAGPYNLSPDVLKKMKELAPALQCYQEMKEKSSETKPGGKNEQEVFALLHQKEIKLVETSFSVATASGGRMVSEVAIIRFEAMYKRYQEVLAQFQTSYSDTNIESIVLESGLDIGPKASETNRHLIESAREASATIVGTNLHT